jgi:hypothetical protein
MKKLLVTAFVAGSLVFGAGHAIAAPGNPNDGNPHNDHGQCTANFNGHKTGQEALSGQALQDMFDYCKGNIGGNPTQNGRYADCFTNTNNDSSDDCSDG